MIINEGKLLHLLTCTTYAAYSASLIGAHNQSIYQSFKNFSIGDLVMELSTVHRTSSDSVRFGFLISNNFEPCYSDDEWEEIKDEWLGEPCPQEMVYRIRLLTTQTEYKWVNASFIKVPNNLDFL